VLDWVLGSSQADSMALIQLDLGCCAQGIKPLLQFHVVRDLAERAVHLQS
jgi:hypothetical protein